MCRWLAYIGLEQCLLEDVLITPAHALTKQVHDHFLPKLLSHSDDDSLAKKMQDECDLRNKLFNIDGLGIGWYSRVREEYGEALGPTPCCYKTTQPPLNDPNFRSLCTHTSTNTLFAHIRAASSTAINQSNNHPFLFGRHSFMHNGTVAHFPIIKRRMALLVSQAAWEMVRGTTDSELLGALYITNLGYPNATDPSKSYTLKQMKQALERSIQQVIDLQRELIRGPVDANSLNLCMTDGERLLAIRFRNSETEQPPSLYYSTTAGVALNRKFPGHPNGPGEQNSSSDGKSLSSPEVHKAHIIIASEPTTYKVEDWTLVSKNTAVLVEMDEADQKWTFATEPVTYH